MKPSSKPRTVNYAAVFFVLIVGFYMVALLKSCNQAHAHGWYDIDCCSDRDCAPADKVQTLENGVMRITVTLPVPYSNNKEKAPFTVDVDLEKMPREKIRSSKDENIHLCLSVYESPPRILCIYLPAGS